MPAIVRRAILPVLLLCGGAASLIYGVAWHSAPVVTEREVETTIEVPLPPARPFGESSPFGIQPAFGKKTVKRTESVTIDQSEPSLTREVTVGGVALLGSGEIKRTYSGKGPSLCPT